jgi:hypothetical protein
MEISMLRNMSLLFRKYEINESNYICLSRLMPHFLHYLMYFDKLRIGEKNYIERREKSNILL